MPLETRQRQMDLKIYSIQFTLISQLKGLSHEFETGYQLCCWIDLSQERTPWWFLKFLKAPLNFKKCEKKRGPSEKRDGNCHVLANSRWEMLLKAVGQPLGTAKRVLEIRWERPKGYWKASGKFLKGIGKPLGNAQITAVIQQERRQNFPAAIGKNVEISITFL